MKSSICFVVVNLLCAGCMSAPAAAPNNCATVDELKAEVEAAYSGGDPARVMDLTYAVETPSAILELQRIMVASEFARKLRLRSLRIVAMDAYPNPRKLPGQYEGRPLAWSFPPTHWMIVRLETAPDSGLKKGEFGWSSLKLTLPIAERDHVWWIVGARFATTGAATPKPVTVREGVELSHDKLFSLKSVVLPPLVPVIPNNQIELSDDENSFTKVHVEVQEAMKLLLDLDRHGRWFKGGGHLPQGYFACEVYGLPRPVDDVFDMCRKEYEKAFKVRISVGDVAWDGFELVPPKKPSADIRRATDDEKPRVRFSQKGDIVTRYSYPEFAEWLEGKAAIPLSVAEAPEGEFTFDVERGLGQDAQDIFDWLYDNGFTVRPKKIMKPTVLIEPAKAVP